MRKHIEQISTGFIGLFSEILQIISNMVLKTHKFLGKTGWFIIFGLLVFRILLASYSNLAQKRTGGILDINRIEKDMDRQILEIQRYLNNQKKGFLHKIPSTYQSYFESFGDNKSYGFSYRDGKISGFIQPSDQNLIQKIKQEIENNGLTTHINKDTLLFNGSTENPNDIIDIVFQIQKN